MSKRAAFRIAIRDEGEFVNGYFAGLDSMDGALLLLSIRRASMSKTPGAFEAFQALLELMMSEAITAKLGIPPDGISYDVEPAPEHEKAGHA